MTTVTGQSQIPEGAMQDRKEQAKVEVATLVEKFHSERRRDQSEADVRAGYIDQLFLVLGWNVYNDPGKQTNYWREGYVQGAGFEDYRLEIAGQPVLLLEAKRFGRIPKKAERVGDRTTEEKQTFRYTRGRKIQYAILTNFERLHLFNADHERLIAAFDSPEEYLERFEELWRLTPEEVSGGSLGWWEGQLEKKDVDLEFLKWLRAWRLTLANAIFEHNASNPELQRNGMFDFDKLMEAVQRILDRLILMRYGDDKEVLLVHDLLENALDNYRKRGAYASSDHLMRDFIELSHQMDDQHNTTLFAPDHLCEKVVIPNKVLASVLDELSRISFRKFTSDILGNTYESYLGTKLKLVNGEIQDEERTDLRKGQGIFYTPSWVVEYIVDKTLGERLKGMEQEHGLHAIEKVRGLSVLDPACGSGSFLIKAYHALADFYRRMNLAIVQEQTKLAEGFASADMFERLERLSHLPQQVLDYPQVILREHLYGVDLDAEAAEIATVNLTMQAFADSRQKKLPKILNENIKVGNSLISGTEEQLKPYFGEAWVEKRRFNWEEEFPAVMERGGFDVVIGNPPYVRVDSLPENDKKLWKKSFGSAVGKYDLYYLFIELGKRLLRQTGRLGYITPNRYCTNSTGQNLRQILLEEGSHVIVVSVSRIAVFADAANYPVITILFRDANPGTKRLTVYSIAQPTDITSAQPAYDLNSNVIDALPRSIIPIGTADESLSLALRILSENKPAKTFVKVQEGLRIPSRHEKKVQQQPSWPLIIKQYQFERYSIVRPGSYLSDVSLEAISSKSSGRITNCRKPKIVFAEDALAIQATLDMASGIPQGGVYFGTTLDAAYDLRYLLGLYNSSLFTFIFKTLYSGIHMGGGYLRFRTQYLEELPVRAIDFNKADEKSLHDDLVDLVQHMLELHQVVEALQSTQLAAEVERTDRQIDGLVYELYGLTAAERRLVEGE
ncbi:MAG: N-6 DNA methylase [Dehalococcoidia bacterium]|nr:N-6 DNA methylase [Dehalococcoidia bacterium]